MPKMIMYSSKMEQIINQQILWVTIINIFIIINRIDI